jgi:hypothetical protein
MNLVVNLAAGVISSIAAVFVVEVYRVARRHYTNRPLKWVLRFGDARATIILPIMQGETESKSGIITTYDAIAISHLLTSCRQAGVSVSLASSRRVARDGTPNIVSVGGPDANPITRSYIESYLPGLVHRRDIYSDGHGPLYVRCGDLNFVDRPERSFGFIARLTSEVTGLDGNAVLVWGRYSMGGAAAAYYLGEHANRIMRLKRDSFVLAVTLKAELGYRFVAGTPIDITERALAPPSGENPEPDEWGIRSYAINDPAPSSLQDGPDEEGRRTS